MAVKKQQQQDKKKETKPKAKSSSSSGGMSKADAFDKTKAAGNVDAGKYEAVIDEFVLQKPNEKGQSARIKYKIASEGDNRGQTTTQWYALFDENEDPMRGLEFFKKDLAILGYDDVKFGDLDEVLAEITEKHIGVVIQVKHNDGFVNSYLQGLCEDSSIIEEFLAEHPY